LTIHKRCTAESHSIPNSLSELTLLSVVGAEAATLCCQKER